MSLANGDGDRDPNRHQPLIDAITSFYHALAESCYIQPSDIHAPPYGPEFNTSLGLSLGYTPESLELLSKLPYLSEECDNAVQLDGASTTPLIYLTDPSNEDDWGMWKESRDPLMQGDDAPLLPRNIVAVTWGQVYGQWLLYDLDSC
ncbi:hypothetical protein BP6252_09751 [Coleophoma cylindrospora]|uniref:Uncharacterized protein n=1 Tax=Coleophoma cylindrospora TaxID=1849047 RepID=A0A3D8QWE9_9HELO|nr:hypothetical protein BP6252_09751 [Coleophoma cylindrospora]